MLIKSKPGLGIEPALYDWQKSHVDKIVFALKKFNVALDASDMGTGKTIMALRAAKDCGLIPVIICPKAVIPIWEEWHRLFFPDREPVVFNYEKAIRGNKFVCRKGKNFGWTVKAGKTLLIYDECHRCKGSKSLNSKLLASAKRDKQKILMLSATPFHTPLEMRAAGYALGLHGYKDWWRWCLSNGCRRGWFGGLEFKGSPAILKRLNDDIFGHGLKGSRIRITDLPEGSFPDGIVEADSYAVDDPAEVDSIYNAMRYELAALEEKSEGDVDPENPLTIQLRARQKVELLKVPVFTELTRDALESGNSVVVFLNFTSTLDALVERMELVLPDGGDRWSLIRGNQTDDDRRENIRLFQSGKARICLVMIQAGGVGLSLHDETGEFPRVALLSPTFSAIDLRQALGRIRRAGGKSMAVQKIIFAARTIEDDVCLAVRRKLRNLEYLNDGDLSDPLTK